MNLKYNIYIYIYTHTHIHTCIHTCIIAFIHSQAIADGLNVNEVDDLKRTPLQVAASTGQVEVMKLLLANGADPNGDETIDMCVMGIYVYMRAVVKQCMCVMGI